MWVVRLLPHMVGMPAGLVAENPLLHVRSAVLMTGQWYSSFDEGDFQSGVVVKDSFPASLTRSML